MKKILLTFAIALGLSLTTKAQGVITAVPCDQLGMSVNVGSQATSINIYHSGQYMTHPQSENIFVWRFSDQQANILHQDTIVNASFCNFGHNWSLTDTINVTVTLVNDSANLDYWYISQGLPTNGNSINCLFEDQIFWYIDTFPTGTLYGTWTFIHNNPGVDQNIQTAINDYSINNKSLIKVFMSIGLIIGLTGTFLGVFLGILFSLNIKIIQNFFENLFNTTLFSKEIYYLSNLHSKLIYSEF